MPHRKDLDRSDVAILDFDTPSQAELATSFDNAVESLPSDKMLSPDEEFKRRVVGLGGGMTAMEFENAISRSLVELKNTLPNIDHDEFCRIVAEVKTEVVRRSEVLELMEPEDMNNVGGLDLLKTWMGKRVNAFTDSAREFGIEPPKGIALIGPPGTGKSLVAKAVSNILGLPLIRFDISRVFKSLVGESEGRVRAALKMVDAMSPCVLLIDGLWLDTGNHPIQLS